MSKEKVVETLRASGVPMKGGEIAAQSGLEKTEVDKHIKALKKDGTVVSPKACYYQIAEGK